MLDSPERVCAGQARFKYPASSLFFSSQQTRAGSQPHGDRGACCRTSSLPPWFIVTRLWHTMRSPQANTPGLNAKLALSYLRKRVTKILRPLVSIDLQ
jgi:hypothetical protein